MKKNNKVSLITDVALFAINPWAGIAKKGIDILTSGLSEDEDEEDEEENEEKVRITEIINKYINFVDNEQVEEAFNYAKDNKQTCPYIYYLAASKLGQIDFDTFEGINLMIRICDETLKYYIEGSAPYCEALCTKYNVMENRTMLYGDENNDLELDKYYIKAGLLDMRKLSFELSNYEINDNPEAQKCIDLSKDQFDYFERIYRDYFLDIPRNKRKILVPVKEYTHLTQDHITVIKIDNIPSSLEFPMGHPVLNQVYVCHPYLTNKYIPFESYELEFIEGRVREFCRIAQYLGATDVFISALNQSSEDGESKTHMNMSAGGKYAGNGLNAKGEYGSSLRIMKEIGKSIKLRQKYAPSGEVMLPSNLVWYNSEYSWKQLYDQRMRGILQHDETIETRTSKIVQGSELKSIAAEFKNLVLSVNGSWDQTIEEKFSEQENAVLTIHVDFAPLELLKTDTIQSNISDYTSSEKEYLQELKECIADFGEINDKCRRFLSRIQKSLGISDVRAAELESSLTPSLTDEEKEYLEEYKLCIEEGGEISGAERRLLNRLRANLNISEERAEELECL